MDNAHESLIFESSKENNNMERMMSRNDSGLSVGPVLVLENLDKSEEFIYNSRGQRLHLRSYWPATPKAVIIYLHGYCAHISRPIHTPVATELNSKNYAYVCLDFHGHGYSEGIRAYIEEVDYLEEDVLSLLQHLYRKRDGDQNKFDGDVCKLTRRAYGLPFYLMGSSLGGSVAIRLGNRLYNSPTYSFAVYFKGCILLSPFIKVHLPSSIVKGILDATVVKLFPQSFVPPSMRRSPNLAETFARVDYIAYVQADEYPANPEGLTYGGPTRFKTASCTVNMVLKMPEAIKSVHFPFLVLHDDKDNLSLVEGIKNLIRLSKTSQNHKEYKQVNKGRHDPLTNRMNDVLSSIVEWLEAETAL